MLTNVSLLILPPALSDNSEHDPHFPVPTHKYTFAFAFDKVLFNNLRRAWDKQMTTLTMMVLVPAVQAFPLIHLMTISRFKTAGDYILFPIKMYSGKVALKGFEYFCFGSHLGELGRLSEGLIWRRMEAEALHRCIAALFSSVSWYVDKKKHDSCQSVSLASTAWECNRMKH